MLVVVEATDVVFAVDSIPAIFAITTDPFIVYTSNIFAILGPARALLRARRRRWSKFHLPQDRRSALVLLFVGAKMVVADVFEIPVLVSLGVVAALLAGGIAGSLLWPRPGAPPLVRHPEEGA